MHRLLKRQLERLSLGTETVPGAELWQRLLERVSASYTQSDEARQLSERAMEISSREMLELHEAGRKANEQLEERVRERTAELAQAEYLARESEARFRSLTELSSDWFWELDKDLRLTSLKGRTLIEDQQSVVGKRRDELPGIVRDDPGFKRYLQATAGHLPFRDLVYQRHDAGVRHFISISGEPVFNERGEFLGYHGTGRNVTQRERGEQLLRLEHTVTQFLAQAEAAPAALTAVMRAMCESEGWDCGRYFRVDEKSGVLRFDGSWSISDPGFERYIVVSRGTVFRPGEGLAGRVWQSGEPLWSTNAGTDTRMILASLLNELGISTSFMFPVTSEGRVIGVIGFATRASRDPDERLLRAVRAIGSQIGQFLQRKKADEKVRIHALQQRLIAEFGQQALASADMDEVLKWAATLIAETLQTDFSNVLELAPDRRNLVFRAAVGWPEEWIGQRTVPVAPGSRLEHTLSRKEPLVVEDYADHAGFVEAPLFQFGVKSGVQVPVFGPKEVFGVLSVHTLQARHFTDDDASFLRSVANILAIAIERKSAEDKLAHLAQFDPVTGLPNRHLFRDRLSQCLTHAQRNDWLAGVLFVDLDRFKAVNDTFGHTMGDMLLNQAAARIKRCMRGGDTVARLSGDEFAVVLSDLSKADDAGFVAQKIVDALAAPFELDGHQTYISASIGIALYPADGAAPDTLVKNADTAMYRAKEQGRNCYQFYLPQMNERLMERLQLESKLRGALDRQEFRLHYQPKVQIESGIISGFEALLRWEQDGKLVPPMEFIPILEDTGLIVPVGEWVLRNVCEQIRQWKDQGIVPRPVAINLSPRQFQHKTLVIMVEQILRETGVQPELLELELTETLLMSDAEEAVEMLRDLKGLGVGLAVDDFGTGYSSLSYLKRFPLDTLKIDRAFIRDAASNGDDATLALTIINLAHSMRLKVVAEGVETEDQLSFLRLHGCDEMQGFYFARPLDAAACTQALVEDRRLQPPSAEIHRLPARNRDTGRLRA